MARQNKEIKLTSYEDLLGVPQEGDKVIEVPLSQLHAFKNHPFYVKDDEKMEETVQSIKESGVHSPGLVRPRVEGGYEIIAGHRRKRACELAGKSTMPVIVRDYTDDEAAIAMVNSNIQRENVLPSEKAFAYKIKMDALRHQGKKGERSAEKVGESSGDDIRKVERYIRLTYLLPELLNFVDEGKMKVIAGTDISYLSEEEQRWLIDAIHATGKYPDGKKAQTLKEMSRNSNLTEANVMLVLLSKKPVVQKVVLRYEKIREYFPEEYDSQQIEEIIFSLLENWKASQG